MSNSFSFNAMYRSLAIWHADVWHRPHTGEQGTASLMVCGRTYLRTMYALEPPFRRRSIKCIKCPGLAQDQHAFNLASSRYSRLSFPHTIETLEGSFFLISDSDYKFNLILPPIQLSAVAFPPLRQLVVVEPFPGFPRLKWTHCGCTITQTLTLSKTTLSTRVHYDGAAK